MILVYGLISLLAGRESLRQEDKEAYAFLVGAPVFKGDRTTSPDNPLTSRNAL